MSSRLRLVVVAALVVSAAGLLSPLAVARGASAATVITVTTTTDEYDTTGSGAGCSLREAIQAANEDKAFGGCPAGSGEDTVVLGAQMYHLTRSGPYESSNVRGDLNVKSSLTLAGAGASSSSIDAHHIDRVLSVSAAVTVTVSAVRLQGGATPSSGGGLYNYGVLRLTHVVVAGNTSGGHGGGIYNHGSLTLVDSVVSGNSNESPTGGLLGGGLFNDSGAALSLQDSMVSGNTGNSAGGIMNFGALVLTGSTISDNHAAGAFSDGGGIGNTQGSLYSLNSTISGNRADRSGGGISSGAGEVLLLNTTMAFNYADYDEDGDGAGGGIEGAVGDGAVYVKNTLIANNWNGSGLVDTPSDCLTKLTSGGYNLIESLPGCTIIGDLTGNQSGTDPLLAGLAHNGGPTRTHALQAGSPAIDAGNPGGCTNHLNILLATDQRGYARHVSPGQLLARCDIGAYEYGASAPAATPTATATATPMATAAATPAPGNTATPGVPNAPGNERIFLPLISRP